MFKSLRRKFITTAVGSVAVVIAILAIALNFINYYKLEERIDTTLLDASKSQALIKIFAEDGDDLIITKNSSSTTDYNGFSIAKVDDSGRIIKTYRDDTLIPNQDALQSKVIEALKEGKPAGLKTLGDWPTIYEGLSKLDKQVQDSWFGFDHFYSDHSFDKALEIVFGKHPKHLMDVGGNTGRFALRCVEYDPEVNVTIVDLPGQIGMMKKNIEGKEGAERINGYPTNILDEHNDLPQGSWDAIWMSQFLDCFSEEEIYSILVRAARVMKNDSTLYIMETFWDRQKYEPASLCLTMTSVYFTVMANGNSKMYHSDDMIKQIDRAGLRVVDIHDGIGQGHTILEVKLK